MIWIRHAEKKYKNGKNEEYSLDPDITEEGKIAAFDKFQILVNSYGPPERIVTSPYLRTRSTAEIARQVIFESCNIDIIIEYDRYLGEYLGNQSDKDLSICLRPETLIHNPIPSEIKKKYNRRMYGHTKRATPNTWYITHGYNICTISQIKNQKIKYPNELCGILINDNNKTSLI